MEINSLHLKTAVMAYYRFKRQSICATEVSIGLSLADILIDNGKEVIEIECKSIKSDIWADSKKKKHDLYKLHNDLNKYACPNKFYICVPSSLIPEAEKWVLTINEKYGIIELSELKFINFRDYQRDWMHMLYFKRKAKNLKKEYKSYKDNITLRACSENINHMLNSIKRNSNVST